jgi:hypothetical protein
VDRLRCEEAASDSESQSRLSQVSYSMGFITKLEEVKNMATQLCQECKQSHPGRVCDYDDKGECAETIGVNEVAQAGNEPSKVEEDGGSLRS